MNITDAQAIYIANYLSKGAFDKNYRDLAIPIAEDAEIGIARRGKNFNLYIKRAAKIVTQGKLRFSRDISVEDLANEVAEVITSSPALVDVELNMKKIPMAELAAENVQDAADDTEQDAGNEEEEYVASESDDDFFESPEIIQDESVPKECKDEYDISSAEHSEEEKHVSPVHTPIHRQDNTIHIRDYKAKPAPAAKSASSLRKNSYIYRLESDADMTAHMNLVFSNMLGLNRELATEIYIRSLNALLDSYGNDIDAMSEDTGIDKRSISLAFYEMQLIN